jgi:UDP-N-acetylglucosamine 2-epimerase
VEGEPQEPISGEAPVGDTPSEESTMTNPPVTDQPDTGEEPITTTEADVQGQVAEEVTPTTEKEEPKPTDNAGTDLATSASDGMVAPTTEQPKRVYDFNGKPVEFTADQVDTLVKQALTNDTQVDTLDYFKSTHNVTKEDLDLLVAAKSGDAKALKKLAIDNPTIDIVYPLHLNPNVQNPVNELLSDISNVYLINPLQYESFIYLMNLSYFIITDSGGVQEEAPSLAKPVLVMRNTTERPEAIDAGTVKLVGTNPAKIISEAQLLLNNPIEYEIMTQADNPYGDGNASIKIIKFLLEN